MALARKNLTIQDNAGNIIDGATVEVRDEATALLPQLYSDRAGTTPIGNPFVAADGSDAGFHVVGGSYKITVTSGAFVKIFRYEAVGLLAELDALTATASLVITPPAGFPQGFRLQQSISGSSLPTGSAAALVFIPSDSVDAGAGFVSAFQTSHVLNNSSAKGGRLSMAGFLQLAAATNAANTNRNYVAGHFGAFATSGDGGTNTGAGALGALFGYSSWGDLQSGATNLLHVSGGEIDVSMRTGSTARYKTGLVITSHELDAVDAADVNAGLAIGGQSGSIKFAHGILFTDFTGEDPVKTTGTLIGTLGTATVANGVDLSGYTISASAFKSTGFIVSGTGGVTATNTVLVEGAASPQVSLTVSAVGKAGFQWSVALGAFLVDTFVAAAPILFRVNGTEEARVDANGFDLVTGNSYKINAVQVVEARKTGYAAFTGAVNRGTTYATGTVTLVQLAERVAAIQADLTTHGLIGA